MGEVAPADLDYLRLMGLTPKDVNNDVEVLRALNHEVKETKEVDVLYDELYEEWAKTEKTKDDEMVKSDSDKVDKPVVAAEEKKVATPMEISEPECDKEKMEDK